MRRLFLQISIFAGLWANAQVVTTIPAFATQNDTVEIIFDAKLGNGDLVGVNPVYAHTGVITNLSTSNTDWRHVQGQWGTADSKVLMTNIGNDRYSIKYHINTFYNVPAGETVTRLAFVFRNTDGSVVGRAADGSDIFVNIFSGNFQALISQPSEFGIYNLTDSIDIRGITSANADLLLYHGTTLLTQLNDTSEITYKLPVSAHGTGAHDLILQAVFNGQSYYDTISYLARNTTNIAADTAGHEEGYTILNDSTVFFKIRAPFKDFIYLIGDFSNWEIMPEFDMNQTPDGEFFWLQVTGLDSDQNYRFQYHIDQEGLRVADPYSRLVLDPWNDPFIPASVYPDLPDYPTGKTNFPVTLLRINETPYAWDMSYEYKQPAVEELVIYELLIRDFEHDHSYQSVIDRLPYLDSLGVNAIELMPIMEFEGNESWGYNPMFFMAPDKYYGTPNDFKTFVDSCHRRGIAVILDIALNHAFGQCPLVRMYFDPSAGQFGEPTAESPWFNQQPKHDFNVGYDFNHESEATEYFTRRVLQHWVEEYQIDGYRMDLSKGFTQNNTLGNVGAWGQYDASRIEILKRIKSEVEEKNPNAIMILEHFADNSEESELSDEGFLLWGNENHQYNEATMGYPSNISSVYHKNRGWSKPHLVAYMESHDEERLVYKNLQFGANNSNYDTRVLDTALQRMELGAAFFFTIPGPKMMWQFGEMGYDFPINYCPDGTIDPGCRVANKPIRWDYLTEPNRARLTSRYGRMIRLRNRFPGTFQSDSVSTSLSAMFKTISLVNGDSSAVVVGNFGIGTQSRNVSFPHTGVWYDFFSEDSLNLNTDTITIELQAGEYHIYTSFKTGEVADPIPVEPIDSSATNGSVAVFPNPVKNDLQILLDTRGRRSSIINFKLYTPTAGVIYQEKFFDSTKGIVALEVKDLVRKANLKPGIYFYEVSAPFSKNTGRLMVLSP